MKSITRLLNEGRCTVLRGGHVEEALEEGTGVKLVTAPFKHPLWWFDPTRICEEEKDCGTAAAPCRRFHEIPFCTCSLITRQAASANVPVVANPTESWSQLFVGHDIALI